MKRWLLVTLFTLAWTPAHAQNSQTATVWFYGAGSFSAVNGRTIYSTATYPVRALATLGPGEYFGMPVAAGVHAFSYSSIPSRGQAIAVTVEPGARAFVEVRQDSLRLVDANAASRAGLYRAQPVRIAAVVEPAVLREPAPVAPPIPPAQVEQGMSGGTVRRFEFALNPYSYVQMLGVDYHGIAASFGIHVADNIAIVSDFSINRSGELISIEGIGVDPRLELFAFRFGPRFTARSGRASVFGQILVGGAHQRTTTSVDFLGVRGRSTETDHGWAGLAGGGIDIGITDWFTIRAIEAAYSPFYINKEVGHGPRITAGLVFHIH